MPSRELLGVEMEEHIGEWRSGGMAHNSKATKWQRSAENGADSIGVA